MPRSDFDFLPGSWHIANRRLIDTLDPDCDEWEEFEATSEARAMLGGVGNVDHFMADGYEGRFSAPDCARFECEDLLEGVPIRMRFDWSEITETSARWEQSFSFDGGATWKPNWTMVLERA